MYALGQWIRHDVAVGGRMYPVSYWVPEGWDGPGRGLVFLHGAGECGTDGNKQLTVGLPPDLEDEPERWPFVVMCPQKPTVESAWEDHIEAVLGGLDWAAAQGLMDPTRVGITGLSQGGHGTMLIGAMASGRFRAVAPVCGYMGGGRRGSERWSDPNAPGVLKVADGLAKMPVWIFHGEKDDVVPPGESKLLAELLQQRNADVKLTLFPNDNHNSWDSTYRRTRLNEWLIEQTR